VKPVTQSMLVDSLVSVFAPPGASRLPASRRRNDRFSSHADPAGEDNEINQQIAVELLEGVGASVDVAHNGREAVDKLLGAPCHSPTTPCSWICRCRRWTATSREKDPADARFARLPIIAMTAHATMEERQRCLDSGMDDHVPKPIDPALLFETLGRFHRPSPGPPPPRQAGRGRRPARGRGREERIPPVEGLDAQAGLSRVAGTGSST